MPGIRYSQLHYYGNLEVEVVEDSIFNQNLHVLRDEEEEVEDDGSPEFIFGDSFFAYIDEISSILRVIIIVCCDVCPIVTVFFDVLFVCQHQGHWREIW